jgi:P27 family predicted phage terminase small subunit
MATLRKPRLWARGIPDMPPGFSGRRAEIWIDTLATIPPGVIAACDAMILASFCIAAETVESAQKAIDETGHIVQTKAGRVKNPWCSILARAQSEMRATAGRLGLDPVARIGIPAQKSDIEDPMAILLGRFEEEYEFASEVNCR